MSLVSINFYSEMLKMETHVTVVMPEAKQGIGVIPKIREGKHPVLLLLHGTSGNSTDWERWTSVERYAGKKGLAVVMPSGQLSAYANMIHGERFFDYVATEVLDVCRKILPLSDKREDTFICGLSMGGYGSLKIGMTYPERFAAVGALSNGNHAYMPETVKTGERKNPAQMMLDRMHLCWAVDDPMKDSILDTKYDVFWLAKKNIEEGKPLPPVYSACGTEDHNYPMAMQMYNFFTSLPGNPYHYEFHNEAGGHTWEFWDQWIQRYLDWIPLKV